MELTMTDSKLKKLATEVLESKLGFKVSRNDIVLLEATRCGSYVRFNRFGFNQIVYSARRKASGDWELCIYNEYPDGESIGAGEELYI